MKEILKNEKRVCDFASCESAKMRLGSILCASGMTVKPKDELLQKDKARDSYRGETTNLYFNTGGTI